MRCAILIAGSLLWDDGENGERKAWRNAHLLLDERMQVSAPLFYGRKSRSRGDTFTMTFSTDDAAAQGILVPCTAHIDNTDLLTKEVCALWRAEAPAASPGSYHRNWGCVGALFGPKAVDSDLAAEWTEHFRDTRPAPQPAIDPNGGLNIPWPRMADGHAVADVDVILATATTPAAVRPGPETVAQAWLAQNCGHERYFFENVRHGIRTPDDGEIWRKIEERTPEWLKSGAYAQAIEILRTEAAGAPITGPVDKQ